MIVAKEIIEEVMIIKGYKSVQKLANACGISYRTLKESFRLNRWTKRVLDKVGKTLNEDLSMFVNAKASEDL